MTAAAATTHRTDVDGDAGKSQLIAKKYVESDSKKLLHTAVE